MKLKSAKNPTTAELLQLIEQAKNAEVCRDIIASQQMLRIVWEDNEQAPSFDYLQPALKAELLRLCGVFLSLYGNASSEKNYQIRAKDLLTNAIDIFKEQNLSDKAAEANIMLAFCYWNSGEIDECNDILDLVEEEYCRNPLHPVYIQACINRMMTLYWKEKYSEALKVVADLSNSMELCSDLRLCAMYHNQAGILNRSVKNYKKAEFHLNQAINYAQKAGNQLFVAINFNNLAFLYQVTENFDQADACITKAITALIALNNKGLLAHTLDTKASIYLESHKYDQALETINESLEYFTAGEDYSGLVSALWTKCRCLLRLAQTSEAVKVYAELQKIAEEKIGAVAVKKFDQALDDEIYVKQKLPLTEEVAAYKKHLVRSALLKNSLNKKETEKELKVKSHQSLSRILKKQFPQLNEELGITQRRSPKKVVKPETAAKPKVLPPESKAPAKSAKVYRLVMPGVKFAFDYDIEAKDFAALFCNEDLMRNLGVQHESVVAVAPIEQFREDVQVLVAHDDDFYVGRIEYDKFARLYFVLGPDLQPIPLDRHNVLGIPIGYCTVEEADKKIVEFTRLGNFD